jgi:hypothetical protein
VEKSFAVALILRSHKLLWQRTFRKKKILRTVTIKFSLVIAVYLAFVILWFVLDVLTESGWREFFAQVLLADDMVHATLVPRAGFIPRCRVYYW